MSRIEENEDMCKRVGNFRMKDTDKAPITAVLVDISKSLAIIADSKVVYKPVKEEDDGK